MSFQGFKDSGEYIAIVDWCEAAEHIPELSPMDLEAERGISGFSARGDMVGIGNPFFGVGRLFRGAGMKGFL